MTSTKVLIGIIAIVVGAGGVVLISHQGHNWGQSGAMLNLPSTSTAHTEAWYVAHPDIAKQDEERCGGDSASLPQADCQNDASAEEELLVKQLQTQAATNSAAANNPKAP